MTNFNADDRGNVVDFYEQIKDAEWEKVARLDREAGDDCNSLAWEDWSGNKDLEVWAISQGYPILDAERLE